MAPDGGSEDLLYGTVALYGPGKLPTYPSLKPTLRLTSDLGKNVGLGEG